MAVLLDQITIGDIRILTLDSDPTIGGGYDAPVGSLSVVPSVATPYFKYNTGVNDWTPLIQGAALTEQVQDIVGAFIVDSADLDFTYNDAGNSETAVLTVTGVSASTYGSATGVAQFTVDSKGRITAASTVPISITSTAVTDFAEAAQDAVGNALVDSASVGFTYNDAGNSITATVLPAGVDHNSLANLTTGDAHTQYALLAGRSGGQNLRGDTASGGNLSLSSTANATKGKILLGANVAVDEANTRFGVGTASPDAPVVVSSSSSLYKLFQASVATTNATQTSLFSYTVPSNKLVYVKAYIMGIDGSNNGVVYERSAGARNNAGTLTQIGLTQSDFTEENLALILSSVTIDVSGTTIRVRVTGVAATNINWYANIEVHTF